jgi:hypothetical protein
VPRRALDAAAPSDDVTSSDALRPSNVVRSSDAVTYEDRTSSPEDLNARLDTL